MWTMASLDADVFTTVFEQRGNSRLTNAVNRRVIENNFLLVGHYIDVNVCIAALKNVAFVKIVVC